MIRIERHRSTLLGLRGRLQEQLPPPHEGVELFEEDDSQRMFLWVRVARNLNHSFQDWPLYCDACSDSENLDRSPGGWWKLTLNVV